MSYSDRAYSDSEEEEIAENALTKVQRKRLQKQTAEVDEVAGIMKVNIDKLLDRGEKLEDLERNAENLNFKAMSFQTTAKKVKTKYWWKNVKFWVLLLLIVLLIVAILVIFLLQPWNL